MTTEQNKLPEKLSTLEHWKQEKMLKKAKKKARNSAMKQHGMDKKTASKAVKTALNRIVASNKPPTRAAGRGG